MRHIGDGAKRDYTNKKRIELSQSSVVEESKEQESPLNVVRQYQEFQRQADQEQQLRDLKTKLLERQVNKSVVSHSPMDFIPMLTAPGKDSTTQA